MAKNVKEGWAARSADSERSRATIPGAFVPPGWAASRCFARALLAAYLLLATLPLLTALALRTRTSDPLLYEVARAAALLAFSLLALEVVSRPDADWAGPKGHLDDRAIRNWQEPSCPVRTCSCAGRRR